MRSSFPASNNSAINVGQHKYDHASQNSRDEEFIEQVDVVYERPFSRAGFVVAHPRIGKGFCCGIGMALLTFDQKIAFEGNACIGICH